MNRASHKWIPPTRLAPFPLSAPASLPLLALPLPLSPQEQKDQSYSTVKTAATRISVNNLKPGTTYVFLIRPFSTPAPSSSLSSSPLSSSSSSSSVSSSASSSTSSSSTSSSSSSSSSSPPPIDYGAYSAPLELQTLGERESPPHCFTPSPLSSLYVVFTTSSQRLPKKIGVRGMCRQQASPPDEPCCWSLRNGNNVETVSEIKRTDSKFYHQVVKVLGASGCASFVPFTSSSVRVKTWISFRSRIGCAFIVGR